MVPPRYWPIFIPHHKHLSLNMWLVKETIICSYMPIEHFAHNPMELYFIIFKGMVSSSPKKKKLWS